MTPSTLQQMQNVPDSAFNGWDAYPTATQQDAINAYNEGLTPDEYVNGGLLGSQG
jgi:hypothetical protein